MCKLTSISSLTSRIVVIALICTISSTALAGVIPSNGVQSILGPGLGTVSVPIILTANPDNDNQLGGDPFSDNNITVPIKRFDHLDYIDIVFQVDNSKFQTGETNPNGVTEYKFFESVDNNTSTNWSSYKMILGFGTGASFSPSPAGDGLDFDAPFYDTVPLSSAFSTVTLGEDMLVFSNGIHGTGSETYQFRIDVPNLTQGSFTLRQVPVPEPSTFALLICGGLGCWFFRRYRRS